MNENLSLSVERGHLVETSVYDADLRVVGGHVRPKPGLQMNGHRDDCRCADCRPDLHVEVS